MTTSKTALSAKRERFCREYLVDSNATQAAIRAGYSPKTAEQQGSRLLGNVQVQQRLALLGQAVADRLGLRAEDVIREAMRLAFSDLGEFVEWGPEGVTLKGSDTLPVGATRCVAEVSETVTDGGGTKRIKLHNKVDALDKLFRHLALYNDKMDLTSGGKPIEKQVVVIGGQRIEF